MRPLFLFTVLFFLLGCGKDGEIGPQGEKGEKGEKGINGANGSVIYSGKSAPSASSGANGDFFLNLTNGDLYGPKTKDGWGQPFNLKGPPGNSGIPGAAGATILSGQNPPTVTLGKNGDFYLDLNMMAIYGPKTNSGWGSPVSLKSDAENGVTVYILKPDWNKNLVLVPGTKTSSFTTISSEYTIPDNTTESYFVIYGAVSNGSSGLDPNISLNQWKEFSGENYKKYYAFPQISIGLDLILTNVKIESIFSSITKTNTKFKFIMNGQVDSEYAPIFRNNSAWVMIKSYKYKELSAKALKDTDKINRFLRLK